MTDIETLKAELERAREESARLREENSRLRSENALLRAKPGPLGGQVAVQMHLPGTSSQDPVTSSSSLGVVVPPSTSHLFRHVALQLENEGGGRHWARRRPLSNPAPTPRGWYPSSPCLFHVIP